MALIEKVLARVARRTQVQLGRPVRDYVAAARQERELSQLVSEGREPSGSE